METLKFTIEDAEIAELLGRQNYSTKESAIFELIKNSYDAGSEICNLYINDNCIKIVDHGCGMNEEDIKRYWMHVGKSNKTELNTYEDRVLAGSKGVGRFALARLGNQVKVFSKKNSENTILWETNWIQSNLQKSNQKIVKGTIIEIYDFRDSWKKKDVDNLKKFLKRVCKTTKMEINVYFDDDKDTQMNNIFDNNKLGINYSSKILLKYNSEQMKLSVNVESDEFKKEVKGILGSVSEKIYDDSFDMLKELQKDFESAKEYLKRLGDFSAELYFNLKATKTDAERFKYKYNNLQPPVTGIILYRNAFSISSYDGAKDWLDIAARARKSPAAATHPTGSWRVRSNQLFGYVIIDKNINSNLKDLANRQGLEEDDFFLIFKEIINFGISRFEKYRQSIIRKIDQSSKNDNPIKEEKNHVKSFLKSPEKVITMTKKEITSLAAEIKDIQREVNEQTKARFDTEKQHKYDVRILNALATQGLRASSIGHELYNKRSALISGYEDIVNALKEFGFWEELNSDRCTQVEYKNVPGILEELEDINKKLVSFIDIILKKVEKQKFQSKIDSIELTLKQIIDSWTTQYKWLHIDIDIKNEMPSKFRISKDVLEVIFDNLILNSIQNNEMIGKLKSNIEVTNNVGQLEFRYSDNGIGLSDKYKDDPMRILDVHETSRDGGHGLGMWIVNNTLNMYNGEVIEIVGKDGFEINFTLKG